MVLDFANSYFSETTTDPETGEEVLALNELLGDNPLGITLNTFQQDSSLDFGIDNLNPSSSNLNK